MTLAIIIGACIGAGLAIYQEIQKKKEGDD